MGSWIEDFNINDFPHTNNKNSYDSQLNSGVVNKPLSKREQLEAELKLLQWHKLANDAAIKAALVQSKSIRKTADFMKTQTKTNDTNLKHSLDNSSWIKKVIENEKVKPLEVSRDYVINYEKKERETAERLAANVDRHISTLKTLRDKIESRGETVSRSLAYREWQKNFVAKKNAVLQGKSLDEVSLPTTSSSNIKRDIYRVSNTAPSISDTKIDAEINRYNNIQNDKTQSGQSKDLSAVLDSLHKLSQLESRITSLERDNAYDQLVDSNEINSIDKQIDNFVPQRTKLQFKKQKGTSQSMGRGVIYALRPKKTAWGPTNKQKPKYNYTVNKSKNRTNELPNTGKGFFITEFDNGSKTNAFASTKLERQRALAKATPAQRNLRNRLMNKKLRLKESKVGERKHQEAMGEIIRRRQMTRPNKPNDMIRASKGASSGIKHNNKYLAEVDDMRNKIKDDITKNYTSSATTRLNKTNGSIDSDLFSEDFPKQIHSQSLHNNSSRRIPMTKTSGTNTRRTDAPRRRKIDDNNFNDIAVAGVGGLRVIRNMRENNR
mmetsp:Transcript_21815/g.19875  ORF Transcript_21815/g.19875 Transcript_21815/m.19875 type:complete len:550 (+) Transcript_21815:39-1688(+)